MEIETDLIERESMPEMERLVMDKEPGTDSTIVFEPDSTVDNIRNLEDNIDTLHLDEGIWGGSMRAQQVVDAYANFNANTGRVEFDLGDGNMFKLAGIPDRDVLVDDIQFV